jgi:SHS2 domain-containing protein
LNLLRSFRNAAGSLLHLWKLPILAGGNDKKRIRLEGNDHGDLLVLWLNELAYLVQTRRLRLAEVEIDGLTDTVLEAAVVTQAAPAGRDLAVEIKSATRTGKLIQKTEDGWLAKVILEV